MELFGKTDLSSVDMLDLKLPVNPGRTLSKSKLKSLAEKYATIPECYINYYPKSESVPKRSVEQVIRRLKRKRDEPANNPSIKRKVGRPKKVLQLPTGIRSITSSFRVE